MSWLYVLIGQAAARIVLMGLFVIVALAVLEWWKNHSPIRHYPERHICGICRAPWYEGHQCADWRVDDTPSELISYSRPLRATITRPTREMDRRNP